MNRVLVLEDDANLREILVDVVESLDYQVSGAESAKVALHLGTQFDFDLVISDIRMAGPTDGLGVLAALKQRRPALACIVITGFADQTAPLRALQIKVDDYLYKPFEVEDIVEAIERVRKASAQRIWYRQVLNRFLRQIAPDQALADLQAARDECLKAWFVSIRSDHLYLETALAAWDGWEELDVEYLRIANTAVPAANQVKSLLGRFQIWRDKLAKDAGSKAFVAPATRSPDKVDRANFRRFTERIKQARLSAEELSLAVTLRRIPAERRSRNLELERLFQRMWT